MTTHPASQNKIRRGFTLVELLIGMTVIAILAGLITVAASRAFVRAREFAIQLEMTQIEQALEQFQVEYGFYPPSFRDFTGPGDILPFLNRISPNHGEGDLTMWWSTVGSELATAANTDPSAPGSLAGSDLVFWLTGLSKNRQFPLTGGGEMQQFFEFRSDRLHASGTGNTANYYQPGRVQTPYVYRDAEAYIPSTPASSSDGAYVRSQFLDLSGTVRAPTTDDIVDANFHFDPTNNPNPNSITVEQSRTVFDRLYFNADSFQLITLGLDGMSGNTASPNSIGNVMSLGADNFVNFGKNGPARLDVVLFEQ